MFSLIVATDLVHNIGRDGAMPWYNYADLQFFKQTTQNHVVIIGRKTFDSIKKPLKNRINIVLSRNAEMDSVVITDAPQTDVVSNDATHNTVVIRVNSIYQILKLRQTQYLDKQWFVIGGAEIYSLFISHKLIDTMYITIIPNMYENCDTKFRWDEVPSNIIQNIEIDRENGVMCNVVKVINEDETAFLEIMSNILNDGSLRVSRSENALSLFGQQLYFDLSNNTLPLLTTRKMFIRGIFEELMLFIRGQTDSEILEKKNINIWRGNTSREFLDSRGLHHLPVGDMGASYGFMFRHFGAKYINCKTDYTGQGVDQLGAVIETIKTNPTDRRMIISLWDPSNLNNCPLPPCLYNYQFYVNQGKLSCMMTQRSSDYVVAGGWNIITGSLLVYLISAVCDLEPDRLIWNIGDVHIYSNLIKQAKEQVKRVPYQFPKLYLKKRNNITEFEFSDLELVNYQSHPAIQLVMNV